MDIEEINVSGKKRNYFIRGILIGVLGTTFLFLLGILVFVIIKIFTPASGEEIQNGINEKIDVITNLTEEYYMGEVNYEDIEEGIYHGIIDSLEDPYSSYLSKKELLEIREGTRGTYSGIGAYIGVDKNTQLPILARIIENTPAEESGLLMGDIITAVGDVETQGLELEDVVDMVKGKEGTYTKLTIVREGEEDFLVIDVERRKIEEPTVKYEMLDNDMGYIAIYSFDTVTVDQFTEALVVLNEKGMKGLILDVRGNPGGSLAAVVDICRMILPEGMIVYTEDKYGVRDEYKSDGDNELEIPMVMLIDSNSASAAEILAAAVKDYKIGTLMGTTTFGKGIVQRIIPLSDDSAVKLTVSNYYTPNGKNIHGIGVEPDIEVKFDGEKYIEDEIDNQLEEAKKQLTIELNK